METEPMGRVTVEASIENLEDLWAVNRGLLSVDRTRRTVVEAVVDTRSLRPSLPISLIQSLGLARSSSFCPSSIEGVANFTLFEAVRFTILGRSCSTDVVEGAEDSNPTIGDSVLTQLDLVIDLRSLTLIGNPAHGGEPMDELY